MRSSPNHDETTGRAGVRGNRTAMRRRRARRRVVLTAVKGIFWAIVLAGVFVFGLGLGHQMGGGDNASGRRVTVEQQRGTVTATLPTKTVTVQRTTTVTRTVPARRPAASAGR